MEYIEQDLLKVLKSPIRFLWKLEHVKSLMIQLLSAGMYTVLVYARTRLPRVSHQSFQSTFVQCCFASFLFTAQPAALVLPFSLLLLSLLLSLFPSVPSLLFCCVVLFSSPPPPVYCLVRLHHPLFCLRSVVHHMHSQGLMHRDLKLSNLLITRGGVLKVADLGSIRDAGRTTLRLTTAVVTLWYRAPELLMGAASYNSSIDIWSIGCLLVELVSLKPLFPGRAELATVTRILRVLGAPEPAVWAECYAPLPQSSAFEEVLPTLGESQLRARYEVLLGDSGLDLLGAMLHYDPRQRCTAAEALAHPFFHQEPLPTTPPLSDSITDSMDHSAAQ
jgi:serine/threonine protein kinase